MLFCFCFGDNKKPTEINTESTRPLVKADEYITKGGDDQKVIEKPPLSSNTNTNTNPPISNSNSNEYNYIINNDPIHEPYIPSKQPSNQKQTPSLFAQQPISIFAMDDDEKASENWSGDGKVYGNGSELYGDDRISHIEHPAHSHSTHSNLSLGIASSLNNRMQDLQQEIILDDELKSKSMQLLTENNGSFMNFIKKHLNRKIVDRMWKKLDDEDNGYIQTAEHIADAIGFILMLYKVKQYQKKTKSKQRPPINSTELEEQVKHLSTWIVRKYGAKDANTIDKVYIYRITQDEFTNNLKIWMDEYMKCDGSVTYETSLR